MQQTKAERLTTAIPGGLIAVMVVLLTLRIGVKVWDKNHPPSTRSAIEWHDTGVLENRDPSSKKLLLLDFTADWCRPCKYMEKTTFLNRTVSQMVSRDFDAIKVIDRSFEDKKNPAAIEDLQVKFGISGFPTVVVALSDKTLVEEASGARPPKEFAKFLSDAIKKADFVRAKVAMYDGKFEEAIGHLDCNKIDFEHLGTRHGAIVYWHILNSLHRPDEAKKAVEKAEKYQRENSKIESDDEWPIPLFRYLLGQSTDKQFLSKAKSKYEQTDAHCCIALKYLQMGDRHRAINEFTTVLRNGYSWGDNYTLARSYLDKLSPQKVETSGQ